MANSLTVSGRISSTTVRDEQNPVPRNTAIVVTVRVSRVAARRRHAAEKPGGSATFAEQEAQRP
jgi:hypothetical protein